VPTTVPPPPTPARRWRALVACVVVVLVGACGGDGPGAGAGARVGVAYEHGGRGDGAENDLAAAGVRRAVAAHDVRVQEAAPSDEVTDREVLLRLLAERGRGLVLAVGPAYERWVAPVAADYPEHTFVVVGGEGGEGNVASVRVAEEEGAFLVGAAAALTSASGRLGVLVETDDARARRHQAGFAAGARHVRPDVGVEVAVLDQAPEGLAATDDAVARELAVLQIQGGADVVYDASGRRVRGVLEAIRRVQDGVPRWAVGSGTDQFDQVSEDAQARLLTTMLTHPDRAVEVAVAAYVEEGGPEGVTVLGLAEGGVGYTLSGGHLDPVDAQLQELGRQVVAGDIVVPAAP
jgi:basic membrane protein A and related proteins